MPVAPSEGSETSYPGLSIQADAAEKFMEEHPDTKVGDELELKMRVKLSGIHVSDERWDKGKRVEFNCLEMNDIKPAGESEGHEDEPEPEPEHEEDESEGGTGNPAIDRLMKRKG
jgi:hypothetical protein